eukprot:jgi/Ulvmu1/2968/UM015_0008.1
MSDMESVSTDELSGEDEEIDEDAAFTREDWETYGDWFEGEANGDSDEDASAGHSQEESEDDAANLEQSSEGSEDDSREDDADEGSEDAHEELLKRVAAHPERASRRPAVVNEAVLEDEHNVAAPAEYGEGLQLSDLLDATELDASARKQLKKLVTKTQVVNARLPKAIQQRQERKAAYVESSKEASKWMPLVQTNRQAPTLRLTADNDIPAVTSAAGLASKHTPISDFEQEIADMLKAAGHQDTASAAKVDEAIGVSRLSAEEWQKRQEALAKNNALLYYQEHKAKRLKKIKSKAYHRHLKKKAAKTMPLDDEASQQARAEEEEFRRAQERLTLKHRNTSRWARRALKRGLSLADDSQRDALHEQLRLGRELRAKAATARDGSDSDDSSDASTGDDGGEGEALSTRDKAELVQAVQQGELGRREGELPEKGLFAMPFMRRALAKQRQVVALEAHDILAAQEAVDGLPSGSSGRGSAAEGRTGRIALTGTGGAATRKRLAGAAGISVADAPDWEGGEEEDAAARTARMQEAAAAEERAAAGGGWASARRTPAATKAVAAGNSVPASARNLSWHEHSSGAQPSGGDAAHGQAPARASGTDAARDAAAMGQDAVEARRDALEAAFAGDDVVAEFERDKGEAAKESTEAIEDPAALPGWGAWARNGCEPEWLKRKKAKAEKERQAKLSKRVDAKLANVIICEKWDKKAAKFTVPELPFPYTQQDVYEKRMRVPLGRDTNTEASFRDLTRPKIIKQTGQIIKPLQRSSAALEAAATKKRTRASVVVVAGGTVKTNRKH